MRSLNAPARNLIAPARSARDSFPNEAVLQNLAMDTRVARNAWWSNHAFPTATTVPRINPKPAIRNPQSLRCSLAAWFRKAARDLPWRRTRDPYGILVSEIMLQQTQVDRVVPKYREFLRRYPTLESLAKARAADVRRLWYPLGYNVRPSRLRRIAQRAVREYHGRIPDTYEGLLAMDGVGRYTAGAVLSFAFQQDAPILDTNVARLLARYFGITSETKRADHQRRLWRLASAVIPRGKGHLINQAMMDFGALVCTARAPLCPTCVLRRTCRSFPVEHHSRRDRRD